MKNIKVSTEIIALLYFINGLICIFGSKHVIKVLPYICGAILLAVGITYLVNGIKEKSHNDIENIKIELAIVIIAIGIRIILIHENSLALIGVYWGYMGLKKGVESMNIALHNRYLKKKYFVKLLYSIFDLTLGFILVFEPFDHKIVKHIFILGLEMIIKAYKTIKPDKFNTLY